MFDWVPHSDFKLPHRTLSDYRNLRSYHNSILTSGSMIIDTFMSVLKAVIAQFGFFCILYRYAIYSKLTQKLRSESYLATWYHNLYYQVSAENADINTSPIQRQCQITVTCESALSGSRPTNLSETGYLMKIPTRYFKFTLLLLPWITSLLNPITWYHSQDMNGILMSIRPLGIANVVRTCQKKTQTSLLP